MNDSSHFHLRQCETLVEDENAREREQVRHKILKFSFHVLGSFCECQSVLHSQFVFIYARVADLFLNSCFHLTLTV